MRRERTPDEDEDYRIQQLEADEERERWLTSHPYDPTCGCFRCDPEEPDDDDETD